MSLAWKNVSVFVQAALMAFVAPAVAGESAGVKESILELVCKDSDPGAACDLGCHQ